MDTPHHLRSGTLVDRRFEIERMLGSGGYGEIYEATQITMRRKVALKVLRPHLARQQKIVDRFQNEARYACNLTHPNTVIYFDFGYDDSHQLLYLAMEFLNGQSLSQRLKSSGVLSLSETTEILEQICGSLQEAHAFGLVHRDIKPANIMLIRRAGRDNFAKVIDFGIAKALDSFEGEARSLTGTGAILGTPSYMAPEQIRGTGDLDARTDVYALGCMVYKMLTGVEPFRGQSAIEVATQHITSPPPMIQSLTQRPLPRRLQPLLERTLSKNRDARPSSMMEFYEAWLEALGEEPDTLPDPRPAGDLGQRGAADEALATLSAPVPMPSPTGERARRAGWSSQQRRTLALWSLVCLGAFVFFIGAGALALKSHLDERAAGEASLALAEDAGTPQAEGALDAEGASALVTAEADASTGSRVERDDGGGVLGEAPQDSPAAPDRIDPEPDRRKEDARAARAELASRGADRAAKANKAAPEAPAREEARGPAGGGEVDPVATKEPVEVYSVTLSVSPWGVVQVGGRTLKSPAQVTLKPGSHTIHFGQRTTPHSQNIHVSEQRRFFQFKIPEP